MIFPKIVSAASVGKAEIGSFFDTVYQETLLSALANVNPKEHRTIFNSLGLFRENLVKAGILKSKTAPFSGALATAALRLVNIVGVVIPYYASFRFFPKDLKEELNATNVVNFLTTIILQTAKGDAFKGFKTSIDAYNDAVLTIKKALFDERDIHAITWKPRALLLFQWCRTLIEATGHPSITSLDGEVALKDGRKINATELKASIYDMLSKFVLPLTCADDIADNIQDREVLSHFISIFLGEQSIKDGEIVWSGKTYEEIQAINTEDASASVPEIYRPLFKIYVTSFKSAFEELEGIVGREILNDPSNWEIIKKAWSKVVLCLTESIEINDRLTAEPAAPGRETPTLSNPTFSAPVVLRRSASYVDHEEEMLAQNMLMSFFKSIEEVIIKTHGLGEFLYSSNGESHASESTHSSESTNSSESAKSSRSEKSGESAESTIELRITDNLHLAAEEPSDQQKMFELGEILGHAANHLATLNREIGDGDFSNTLLLILSEKIKQDVSLSKTTLREYYSYDNVILPEGVHSFRELLKYVRTTAKEKLMSLLNELIELRQKNEGVDWLVTFERKFDDCSSINDFISLVLTTFESNEKYKEKLAEFQALSYEFTESVKFITELTEEVSRSSPLSVYLHRIDGHFKALNGLASKFDNKDGTKNPFSDYVAGVHQLVSMYLLFKSHIE